MVVTRSQTGKNTTKNENITLTCEDLDCARTLMLLRNGRNSLPTSPIRNIKIDKNSDKKCSMYNLRNKDYIQ